MAAFGTGRRVLERASLDGIRQAGSDDAVVVDRGVVTSSRAKAEVPDQFVAESADVIAQHRAWERSVDHVPA